VTGPALVLEPWWDKFPDRLRWEIDELKARGIKFVLDEDARAADILRMRVWAPAGGDVVELEVTFPDLYPLFRPSINSAQLRLGHHLDPFGGDLCLIARGSRHWSEEDSLGWLLEVQLPKVLADEIDPDQGEPVSAFLDYRPNAALLVGEGALPSTGEDRGKLEIAVSHLFPDGSGRWLGVTGSAPWDSGSMAAGIADTLAFSRRVEASWFRLERIPATNVAREFWKKDVVTPEHDLPGGLSVAYQLMLFPEEHSPGEHGVGGVLLVRASDQRPRHQRRQGGHRGPVMKANFGLVRISRVGAAFSSTRIPGLHPLSSARILIVGCGALGSVVAEQLARAGVGKLILIDGDVLDAGNLVRHAASLAEVGLTKASAVAHLVRSASPGTSVEPLDFLVGTARSGDQGLSASSTAELVAAVNRVDVIVDATAEIAVHEVLSLMAFEAGVSLVVPEASPGVWGGVVATLPAGSEACGNCLEFHRQEGHVPAPPSDPTRVQPIGCSEPTFTGSGFDLAEVAMQAVRMVVEAMASSGLTGATADVLQLRDAKGARTLPRWERVTLPRHPRCRWH
jgi:hypothetical protein